MGEVLLARETSPGGMQRLVVVKRVLPQLAAEPDFAVAFSDEARVGMALNHPNIVRTLDAGQIRGRAYIALEHVQGPTLVKLLARAVSIARRFSVPLALHIAQRLARALEHVHEACDIDNRPLRVVHMDVAPHNVLIDEHAEPRLHDFGIARMLERPRRTSRDFRGRSAYLAPEQLDGLPVDERVDIFALGVLMHEMLAGRSLFRAPNDQMTVTRILHARISPPAKLRSDVPERLSRIVMRALSRDRDARFATAADLLRELDACAMAAGIVSSTSQLRLEISALARGVNPAIVQQLTPTAVDPNEFQMRRTTTGGRGTTDTL